VPRSPPLDFFLVFGLPLFHQTYTDGGEMLLHRRLRYAVDKSVSVKVATKTGPMRLKAQPRSSL
jgi:hypothetical protein